MWYVYTIQIYIGRRTASTRPSLPSYLHAHISPQSYLYFGFGFLQFKIHYACIICLKWKVICINAVAISCLSFALLLYSHIVDTTTTWPHSDQNTDTCHFFSKVFQSTTSFYLILWNLMLGPNICSTQLSCLPLNASYMDFCNSIQHLGSGPFF